jgi:hypothetical protein
MGRPLVQMLVFVALSTVVAVVPVRETRANSDAADAAAKTTEAAKRLADGPPLDDIIVNGKRDTLGRLRTEMDKAEDSIYAGYNEINTEPEYETHCREETDSQTRMRKRICQPKFVDTEQANYAQERIRGRENIDPSTLIAEKMPAYRKHFMAVVLQDPKLSKAASDYFALYQRYEKLKKEQGTN